MKNAVIDIFNNFLQLDRVKSKVSKFWYRYLNDTIEEAPDVCFLNYGCCPLGDERIDLLAEDEMNRMHIQLYHRVAAGVDLSGLDVLEISCGRGGGAKYIKHYLKPRTLMGMDRAKKAVAFCRKYHAGDGLCFTCGDAEAMPVADGSFDAVVNIEASHDYVHLNRFLREVKRVLRPGGYFLYADFRKQQHCKAWRDELVESGLRLLEEEDITRDVLRGLELNTEHNTSLVRRLAPRLLRRLFLQFAGIKGSCICERFDSGRSRYLRYVLRK